MRCSYRCSQRNQFFFSLKQVVCLNCLLGVFWTQPRGIQRVPSHDSFHIFKTHLFFTRELPPKGLTTSEKTLLAVAVWRKLTNCTQFQFVYISFLNFVQFRYDQNWTSNVTMPLSSFSMCKTFWIVPDIMISNNDEIISAESNGEGFFRNAFWRFLYFIH